MQFLAAHTKKSYKTLLPLYYYIIIFSYSKSFNLIFSCPQNKLTIKYLWDMIVKKLKIEKQGYTMRNETIAKVLKEYRKRNHYTVNDVSIMLKKHSMDVAPKTIYGWESGQAQPSADTLLALCEIYNITDILDTFGYESRFPLNASLTPHEYDLIKSYREHPELQIAVDILLGYDPKK